MRFRGPATSIAQDETSNAVYAVLARHALLRLDFDNENRDVLAQIQDPVTDFVVRGSDVYYVSTFAGRVGRVDLRTNQTLWKHSVGIGARALALTGDRIVVTSPATDRVEALSAVDGHSLARRSMAGAPYGLTVADGRLYVSLAKRDQLVQLDSTTLAELSRLAVPQGPRQLVTQGRLLWVRSTLAHVLQSVVPDSPARLGPRLLMSDQKALTSGNGSHLAVQGMERVTVLTPKGNLRRLPLTESTVLALLVQRDGAVVIGYGSGLVSRVHPD